MHSPDFTYLLQHPESISHKQTQDLNALISKYPYMQSARAIYLKGLKNESSLNYNQELKTTAAYTADRSILFDFITSENFIQNEISHFIKKNTEHLKEIKVTAEDISINKSITVDEALKKQIHETQGVLDPALFTPKVAVTKNKTTFNLDESTPIEDVTDATRTQEVTNQDILDLGKPLPFDKTEKHSFNEWLNLTRFKPIERSKTDANTTPKHIEQTSSDKAKKFQLIDKFIANNPKISPAKLVPAKGNLAKAQMIKPEALMTETLARIYVEQKNYKKAIQSYKILSLKYPEKSSFFANQIKAVEQLQEQNNKE